jgi:hypothetical protein
MEAIANALGPWYTILGFLATLIGLAVYLRKWLKSIRHEQEQQRQEQEQTRQVAQEAANSAGDAAHAANNAEIHAKNASASAGTASDSSTQVEQAIILLATELGIVKQQLADKTDLADHLKERTDDLFGALALAEARRKQTNPESLPIQVAAALDTDATTITGKHRLHTSMIPTTNATPTQDDDNFL